MEWESCTSPIQ